ncbi:hypothetical protein DPC56_05885 [Methanothermobacter tenebrarum]|uniref:Uncharacterized protein n=1 Tax=Methanothermobacter tenebrarum TaxID=680118 RepID=A0A328P8Z3_9EURY|nr:hypothetical protein DPC56_05885 [Methanothermobacter tenebrarum]
MLIFIVILVQGQRLDSKLVKIVTENFERSEDWGKIVVENSYLDAIQFRTRCKFRQRKPTIQRSWETCLQPHRSKNKKKYQNMNGQIQKTRGKNYPKNLYEFFTVRKVKMKPQKSKDLQFIKMRRMQRINSRTPHNDKKMAEYVYLLKKNKIPICIYS